jgi:two-component system KDP operon response regulator KdpE
MSDVDKKKRVLLVDDHPKVLRFVEIDLRLRGFEVFPANSGHEALGLVKSVKPDIMLMDIIMPGMDGFELLRQLRAFTDLPVIAFSASPDNQESVIRVGANDFISKPFDADEMVKRIERLLR